MQARRRLRLINTIIEEEEDPGIRLSKIYTRAIVQGSLFMELKFLFHDN
jgi:hypothetical protein